MNHRSLIFDLFGGYVRYDGGVVELKDLAAVARCFGVSGDSVRVVMSRLRREGWFEVSHAGGRAQYSATNATWELLDAGHRRIFADPPPAWSGNWYLVIYEVPESERAVREELRKTLAWLGFGPLAASTWLSPHDRVSSVLEWAHQRPTARVDTLIARSRGPEQDHEFVARCWDLDGLARDYERFLDTYGSPEAVQHWRGVQGSDALVTRLRLAHDYRLFLFRDPGLPAHLLPADWPGTRARSLFAEAHAYLEDEAMAAYRFLVRATSGSSSGSPPAADLVAQGLAPPGETRP